jgi:hypothetical protein
MVFAGGFFPLPLFREKHVPYSHDCSQFRQERRGRDDGRVRTYARAHCGGLYCRRCDHRIAGESGLPEHRNESDSSSLRMRETNAMVRVPIAFSSGKLDRVLS